jgi:hypothetical protein
MSYVANKELVYSLANLQASVKEVRWRLWCNWPGAEVPGRVTNCCVCTLPHRRQQPADPSLCQSTFISIYNL